MMYYSQLDPAWKFKKLPNSNLTVGDYGCYLCSMATLAQRNTPGNLLVPSNYFAPGGLIITSPLATFLGMFYVGSSTVAPKGWCIGRTDKYAGLGFPTHFLPVNVDTNEMIDPLKYPAKVEPLTYKINQYRIFTGVDLKTPAAPPSYTTPDAPQIPVWAQGVVHKAALAGIQTPLTESFGDMPIYQALLLIEKYMKQ